jgi:hypothetical protein
MSTDENVPEVRYAVVPGFPHRLVGTDGSYWDRIEPKMFPRQYVRTYLASKDGKTKFRNLHQIVLTTFKGPCPDGMESCHGDGDPHNNQIENLRWDTPKSNCADRLKHERLKAPGGKIAKSKLTAAQIPMIRELYRSGMNCTVIGNQFGVTRATISLVIRGDTWKHVYDPYGTTMRRRGRMKGPTKDDPRTTDQLSPEQRSQEDDRRT